MAAFGFRQGVDIVVVRCVEGYGETLAMGDYNVCKQGSILERH